MNSQTTIIAILATAAASLALADDFKTINGKEYKDATVSRVEPDGILLKTKSGISKLYFVELPKDVQERFGYDPQRATVYSAEQNAATQKTNQQLGKEQAGIQWMAQQEQTALSLQDRLRQLEQEKADLLQAISDIKRQGEYLTVPAVGLKGHAHDEHYLNPAWNELPGKKARLGEVDQEIRAVKDKVQQAQQ
ncbi:MAG: hypothetical protein ACREFF_15455 [Candidatus Udaeobacter sp.]